MPACWRPRCVVVREGAWVLVTASVVGVPSEVGSDRALPGGPFLPFRVVGRGRPRPDPPPDSTPPPPGTCDPRTRPLVCRPSHRGGGSGSAGLYLSKRRASWRPKVLVGRDHRPPFPAGDRPGELQVRLTPSGGGSGSVPRNPLRRSGRVPAALPRATWRGSDALRLWLRAPGGWTTPTGAAGRYTAALTPVGPRSRVRPPRIPGAGVPIHAHRLCPGPGDSARFTTHGVKAAEKPHAPQRRSATLRLGLSAPSGRTAPGDAAGRYARPSPL